MLKRLINGALRPFRLEIRRYEPLKVPAKYYLAAIEELAAAYTALGDVELPENARRTELMARLTGTMPGEALHVLHYLHASLDKPGDVCEFGIAAGATSALIANEIEPTGRTLWLFDSFQGLPRPTEADVLIDDIHGVGSMAAYEGRMAFKQTEIDQRLRAIGFPTERVMIVPGFIEETRKSPKLPPQVAFAYIDFDFYEPIKITLELLHERMAPGAHIVIDDYGHFSEGAQKAVDEFVSEMAPAYTPLPPRPSAGYFMVLRKEA
jgi:hypothetical protein